MEFDSHKAVDLLASKFIQRRDVKAVQRGEAYMPVVNRDGDRLPWKREDLEAHVTGKQSLGHYLVGTDNQCKLFAFDIDLDQPNKQIARDFTWVGILPDGTYADMEPKPLNPREAWKHPKAPDMLRRFLTAQLQEAAQILAHTATEMLGIPVAVAYSGNKGMHVYGLTGAAPANDVRGAAMEVMQYAEGFAPLRGNNFFKHDNDDPRTGLGCISVEVFPKQDKLDGKDLGNLMRLPLGINAKSDQRSYFVTLSSEIDTFTEMDPVVALEGGNPWQ